MTASRSSTPGEPADWLSFISESARLGYWRCDLAAGTSEWSPLCAALLGTTSPLDYAGFLTAIHLNDRPRLDQALRAALAASAPFDEDVRLAAQAPASPVRWLQVKGRVVQTPGALPHLQGLLLDASARKTAEETSREVERRLHQAAEAARVVFWEVDLRTGYTRCSPNAVTIWGFSEAPGDAFFERIHPDDRDQVRPRGAGFGEERAYAREYRVTAVDGTVRWIHSRGDVVCDEHGAPIRLTGVSIDLTERKLAEQALRENEELLRIAQLYAGFAVWSWDAATGKVHDTAELEQLYGAPPGGLATYDDWRRLLGPEVHDRVAAERDRALAEKRQFTMEFPVMTPAGGKRWMLARGRGEYDAQGKLMRVTGVDIDITERKTVELAFAAANERFERAQQAARLGSWDWDLRTGAVVWSDGIYDLLGVPRGSIDPSFDRWMEVIVPEDLPATRAAAEDAIRRGGHFSIEMRARRADGAVRWISIRGRVEHDAAGHPARMVGINVDITDRKTAEEELSRSEREFRSMFELVAIGAAMADATGRFTRVNDGLCEFTGYSREELLQKTFWELTHPDDRALDREGMERALADHAENWSVEKRYLRKDGSIRWGLLSASLVRDEQGGHHRTIALVVDITERKRGEQALRENQARERAYMEHLPVGVWFVDADGQVIYGNPAARQIWGGMRYVDLDGLKEYKAWWHGTRKAIHAHEWASARAIRNGETSLDELVDIECFDGTRKTILNASVPLRDAEGRITGAVVFNQDITKLKDAERQLREKESTLRSFYESSPLLMGVVEVPDDDSDIIHIYDNPAVEHFMGAEPGSLPGKSSVALGVSREILAAWIGPYRESERTGKPVRFEYHHGSDRDSPWLSCAVACIGRAASGRMRFSYIAEDISLRKSTEFALVEAQARLREHAAQLERTVAERTAELREINEQLETFVYSVAHDLRAPLRSLTGFSQLLVEDHAKQLDPEGKDMLRRIQRSSEFMDKLVLDLLAFGRTARAEVELSPVHVAEAWMAACFQCAEEIKRAGARIELDEPLPRVIAHEATLGQMLANLLGNALKFVAPGVTPHVRFRAEHRGEFIRLWVEDNGTGISPDQHERVFRVFERLHGSTYPGTGVGLAIVRKGAERLGGRAGVESTLGQGSRFWIDLKPA